MTRHSRAPHRKLRYSSFWIFWRPTRHSLSQVRTKEDKPPFTSCRRLLLLVRRAFERSKGRPARYPPSQLALPIPSVSGRESLGLRPSVFNSKVHSSENYTLPSRERSKTSKRRNAEINIQPSPLLADVRTRWPPRLTSPFLIAFLDTTALVALANTPTHSSPRKTILNLTLKMVALFVIDTAAWVTHSISKADHPIAAYPNVT